MQKAQATEKEKKARGRKRKASKTDAKQRKIQLICPLDGRSIIVHIPIFFVKCASKRGTEQAMPIKTKNVLQISSEDQSLHF